MYFIDKDLHDQVGLVHLNSYLALNFSRNCHLSLIRDQGEGYSNRVVSKRLSNMQLTMHYRYTLRLLFHYNLDETGCNFYKHIFED